MMEILENGCEQQYVSVILQTTMKLCQSLFSGHLNKCRRFRFWNLSTLCKVWTLIYEFGDLEFVVDIALFHDFRYM